MTRLTKRFLVIVLLAAALSACSGKEDRIAGHLERGKELFAEQDFTKARLEFKNVLQIDPKNVEGLFMMARVEEEARNFQRAFGLYQRAVEIAPQNAAAQIRLARMFLLGGAPDKSLEAVEAGLVLKPDDPEGLVVRALAKVRLGDKRGARQDLERVLAAKPGFSEAIGAMAVLEADEGQANQGVQRLRTALESQPGNTDLNLILIRLLEQQGNVAEIPPVLETLSAAAPENLAIRIQLHNALVRSGELDRAEAVLREAVAMDADRDETKLFLVEFLARNRSAEQAEAELKTFVAEAPDRHALRLGLGRFYIATGNFDAAKITYREVIELDGVNAHGLAARRQLARRLFDEGELDEASTLVEEVLVESATDSEALVVRSGIFLRQGQPDRAIADLRTVLRDTPDSSIALRLIARAHAAQGELELAEENSRKAVEANPQDQAARLELAEILVRRSDFERAVTELEALLQVAPDQALAIQAIARIRLAEQKWDDALASAKNLQKVTPDSHVGFLLAGLAHQGAGRLDESIPELESALERAPDDARVLAALTRRDLAAEEGAEGQTRLMDALARNPENFLVQNLLGELLGVLQRGDEAESAFRQAIELRPEWPLPYRNLAAIFTVRDDTDATIEILRRGVDATNGDVALSMQLGSLYERTGQFDLARDAYEALLERFPNMVVAANNLAMVLVDSEPPVQDLDRAGELAATLQSSTSPLVLDTVGWVQFRRGEIDSAIVNLERAAAEADQIAVIQYHLGMAYHAQGRSQEAEARLRQALETEPDFPGADEARATLARLNEG